MRDKILQISQLHIPLTVLTQSLTHTHTHNHKGGKLEIVL